MNSNYIDPKYTGRTLLQNNLKKLKSDNAKSRFINKFNKRFFILDLNNYYLGYKDKMTSSKIVSFSLKDLINIDPNPRIIDVCDWKFAFVVQIGHRIYHLYADSVSVHNEWCNALKACLKPIEKMVFDMNPGRTSNPEARSSTPENEGNKQSLPAPYVESDASAQLLSKTAENTHSELPPEVSAKHNLSQFPGTAERPELAEVVRNSNPVTKDPETSPNIKPAFHPRPQASSSIYSGPANYGNPVSSQMAPLPVFEKSHSHPVKNESPARTSKPQVFSGPKFEVIKTHLKSEPAAKSKAVDSDEEVEVLSGPVHKKQEVDLTPVVFTKDLPMYKGLPSPKVTKKVETTPANHPKLPPASAQTEERFYDGKGGRTSSSHQKSIDTKVEFKSGGILEMLNDFDGLGLETVNIRPMNELKKNLKISPKPNPKELSEEVKEAFVKPNPPVREKAKLQVKENFNSKDNEFFTADPQTNAAEKKNTLGKISVKPGFNRGQARPAYVEKPDIVPDDLPAPVKNSPKARKTENAMKVAKTTKFVSNSNPQGNDCDWENWDD